MRRAQYVGRVGGLAVALSLWAAAGTAPAIASADESGTTSSSSPDGSSSVGSTSPSGATQPGTTTVTTSNLDITEPSSTPASGSLDNIDQTIGQHDQDGAESSVTSNPAHTTPTSRPKPKSRAPENTTKSVSDPAEIGRAHV